MNLLVLVPLLFAHSALAYVDPPEGAPKPVDRSIRWAGDIRVRHEMLSSDEVINGSAHQQRLTFRLGGKSTLSETTDVEFRMGTGTGRTTLNQTQGQTSASNSGFLNLDFRLDRAFFHWHRWKGSDFYGGRIKNTFLHPGGNDLQFDTDLNFDGWSASYRFGEARLQPFVSVHYYWVNKSTSSAVRDVHLLVSQAGVRSKGGALDWALAFGLFRYDHLQDAPVVGSAKGNSTVGGNYARDFRLAQIGAEAGPKISDTPIVFYADAVQNVAAPDDRLAYIFGVRYGEQKKAGDFQVAYDYRVVEKDAVVGAFAEGEIVNGAGANERNHRLRVCYVPSEGVCVGAMAAVGKKNIAKGQAELKNNRYMVDLQYGF